MLCPRHSGEGWAQDAAPPGMREWVGTRGSSEPRGGQAPRAGNPGYPSLGLRAARRATPGCTLAGA